MSFTSSCRSINVFGAFAVALLSVAAPLSAQSNSATSEWTQYVPADARLYVEFRDLAKSRQYLQRAGIWSAIRRLGDSVSDNTRSQPWQQRTEELLSLTIEQTITVIIGTRTALIATDPLHWDRGVVMAEVGNAAIVPHLLKRWRAVLREPVGVVSRYELPTGLLVAHRGRLLLFGPSSDDDGLWSRTVLLLAGRGGPALAASKEFAEMSGELPADFDGLMYVKGKPLDRFLGQRDGLAASDAVLLAAIQVKSENISVELRTRPAPTAAPSRSASQPVAPLMPDDSLFVWSGRIDLAGFLRPNATSQPDNRFGLSDILPRAIGLLADFGRATIDALGDRAVIVVGRDSPDGDGGFEQPTIALVLETRTPFEAGSAMDGIVMLAWQWAVSNSPGLEQSVKPSFDRKQVDDVEIHTFPLGTMLARRTKCPFFKRLDLSWCAFDHWLVVSTSLRHAERIVVSIRGRAPRIQDDRALRRTGASVADDSDWLFLRGTAVASMLRSWLTYLRAHQPATLDARFWADWAARRIEKERRFGIGVRPVPNRPGEVEIVEVSPNSFADGWLRRGDTILSVDGKPLPSSRPAQEIAERFRAVPGRSGFALGIRRSGHEMTIGVPVEPSPLAYPERFDPISAIRLTIELSEHIETLTIQRRVTTNDRFSARILICWSDANSAESK